MRRSHQAVQPGCYLATSEASEHGFRLLAFTGLLLIFFLPPFHLIVFLSEELYLFYVLNMDVVSKYCANIIYPTFS